MLARALRYALFVATPVALIAVLDKLQVPLAYAVAIVSATLLAFALHHFEDRSSDLRSRLGNMTVSANECSNRIVETIKEEAKAMRQKDEQEEEERRNQKPKSVECMNDAELKEWAAVMLSLHGDHSQDLRRLLLLPVDGCCAFATRVQVLLDVVKKGTTKTLSAAETRKLVEEVYRFAADGASRLTARTDRSTPCGAFFQDASGLASIALSTTNTARLLELLLKAGPDRPESLLVLEIMFHCATKIDGSKHHKRVVALAALVAAEVTVDLFPTTHAQMHALARAAMEDMHSTTSTARAKLAALLFQTPAAVAATVAAPVPCVACPSVPSAPIGSVPIIVAARPAIALPIPVPEMAAPAPVLESPPAPVLVSKQASGTIASAISIANLLAPPNVFAPSPPTSTSTSTSASASQSASTPPSSMPASASAATTSDIIAASASSASSAAH